MSAERFTMGLVADVRAVLKSHGYLASPEAASHAEVLVALLALVRAYEGAKD